MSFTDMTFSFEAMRWIVLTAIGIYAWFIGRQSASSAELLELRTRLTTLEAQMAQVPSQSQLHELVATVASLRGSIDTVAARIEPVARSVDRVSKDGTAYTAPNPNCCKNGSVFSAARCPSAMASSAR